MSKFLRIKMDGDPFEELKSSIAQSESTIISFLARIGEEAVRYARLNHTNNWTDQTGNLRSSIGYVILKDGYPIIQSATQQFSGPKGNGYEGAEKGAEMLGEVASNFTKGYALIVCAGMNYASYVEDIHNKDVLTGAKQKAKEMVKELFG